MNASPAQMLTLENYKAHLQSVMAELSSVISELESVLQKKAALESDLVVTKSDLESQQKIRELLQVANASLSQNISDKSARDAQLDQAITDKQAQFDREESARKKQAQDFIVALGVLGEVRARLEAQVKSVESQRDVARDLLDVAHEQHEQLMRDIVAARNLRQKETDEHQQIRAQQQREKTELEMRVASLHDQHIAAQANAGVTDRVLADREERVRNSELNIQIIQVRLKRIWEKYFPGMTAPIL